MATVRTRKRGKKYSYIFEAGTTIDGKRRVIEKGGFPTKQSAYDEGLRVYNQYIHGGIRFAEKIKTAGFLTQWLEVKKPAVRPLTYRQYVSTVKKVSPIIGNLYLQSIRPKTIANLLDGFYHEGMALSSLRSIRAILSSAFRYAIYPAELIATNPASNIPLPKNAPRKIVTREVVPIERYNEIIETARRTRGEFLTIPLAVMYHTGMRISEVLGLTWDNVDLDRGMIEVKKQVISEHGYYLAAPKTESSLRSFYIDFDLLGILREWKERQRGFSDRLAGRYIVSALTSAGKIKTGSKSLMNPEWGPVQFVCTRDNGRPVRREVIATLLREFHCNAHSFRHTHATRLIELGARAKDVAARLGHKSVLITEDLYTHETDALKRDTADRLDRAFMQTND